MRLFSCIFLMNVVFLVCGQAQVRIIGHVTPDDGDFTTHIQVANSNSTTTQCTLTPYDRYGNKLNEARLPVPPNTTLTFTSDGLFLGGEASHFTVQAAGGIKVTASYRVADGRGTPAQVQEVTNQGRLWRIYPGDWNEAWDGVAVVNTELEAATVTISQIDSTGAVQETKTIDNSLEPWGKALFVIGGLQSVFTPRDDVWYRIESSHLVAVTALRGTNLGADQAVGLLWDAGASLVEEPPLHSYASVPIGSAASVWRIQSEPRYLKALTHHFNGLTPENEMKMQDLQPQEGVFDWRKADFLVELAEANNMEVHGHTLVWHESLPGWVWNYQGTPQQWETMLRTHVQTVAARYKGRVKSWDVVNESYHDNGTLRDTPWRLNLGDDYQARAFQWAREADPDAILYYNDFNLSGIVAKLNGVLAMADDFRSRTPPVPMDGIGFQMHILHNWPDLPTIRSAFEAVAARGLIVKITELDLRYNENLEFSELTDEMKQLHRQRVRDIIAIYRSLPTELQGGISVWGISDADTWVRFIRQRADWPLLLDDHYRVKPAFLGFREGLLQPLKR